VGGLPASGGSGRGRLAVREIGLSLITVGVVIFLFVAYQLWGTGIAESHSQSSLAKQFAAQVAKDKTTAAAAPTAPPPAPTLPGGAIAHLVIPKISVNKYVVEGTNENDLREGPGHYKGTPMPGQVGNVGIAGHRTTYGAPFFELNRLGPGDPIYITDLDGRTWVYKVSGPPVVVSPDDVAVLDPTPFAQLTLTTCNPRFSATSRLVVFARLVGQALPPSPATSKTAPAAKTLAGVTNLGQGEPNAWIPTLLYGLLAVAVWVLARIWMARARGWHKAAAVSLGIAVALVPLWFTFENAVLMLPQSI